MLILLIRIMHYITRDSYIVIILLINRDEASSNAQIDVTATNTESEIEYNCNEKYDYPDDSDYEPEMLSMIGFLQLISCNLS